MWCADPDVLVPLLFSSAPAPPPPPEEPPKLLDDLFRKTKATPCVYWLPLTDQQLAEREQEREKRREERAKARKEKEEQEKAAAQHNKEERSKREEHKSEPSKYESWSFSLFNLVYFSLIFGDGNCFRQVEAWKLLFVGAVNALVLRRLVQ